jgi:hypothetical protein
MQSTPGAARATAARRSVVKVAIPQRRGKWLPTNASRWIDRVDVALVMQISSTASRRGADDHRENWGARLRLLESKCNATSVATSASSGF